MHASIMVLSEHCSVNKHSVKCCNHHVILSCVHLQRCLLDHLQFSRFLFMQAQLSADTFAFSKHMLVQMLK